MRELQSLAQRGSHRRTTYAPDEMLDRAVLANQGNEVGIITGLLKVKRTYKGFIVTLRIGVQQPSNLARPSACPSGHRSHARPPQRGRWVTFERAMRCRLTSRSTRWTPLNLSECLTVILLMAGRLGLPKRG